MEAGASSKTLSQKAWILPKTTTLLKHTGGFPKSNHPGFTTKGSDTLEKHHRVNNTWLKVFCPGISLPAVFLLLTVLKGSFFTLRILLIF
jgi:hypothetical protein